MAKLTPLPQPMCRSCCRPLEYGDQCATCRFEGRRLDAIFVRYPFRTPLRDAVHRLKFQNKRYLARDLAGVAVEAMPADTAIDGLVPVPLHPTRERERGYNQSALIASAVGELVDLPVRSDILERVKATPAQTRRPRAERLMAMRGAFSATTNLKGARLLLVDDVLTTGATLDAAVRALKRRQAAWVGAVVVAHQPSDSPHPWIRTKGGRPNETGVKPSR